MPEKYQENNTYQSLEWIRGDTEKNLVSDICIRSSSIHPTCVCGLHARSWDSCGKQEEKPLRCPREASSWNLFTWI